MFIVDYVKDLVVIANKIQQIIDIKTSIVYDYLIKKTLKFVILLAQVYEHWK